MSTKLQNENETSHWEYVFYPSFNYMTWQFWKQDYESIHSPYILFPMSKKNATMSYVPDKNDSHLIKFLANTIHI